jgi:serine/threonine protein kinase
MLSKDPKERVSTKEALNHAWFNEDQSIIQSLLTLNKKLASKNEPVSH